MAENTEPATPEQIAAQNEASQGSTGENRSNDDGTVSSKAELGSNNPTSSTNPAAGSEGDKIANDKGDETYNNVNILVQTGKVAQNGKYLFFLKLFFLRSLFLWE